MAQRERRTALVIGNGAYGADGRLNNPPNDTRDVAKALRQLGFEVTERFDLDQQQMEEEIEKFNRQLRQGGVGLFYYSGHGMQPTFRRLIFLLRIFHEDSTFQKFY